MPNIVLYNEATVNLGFLYLFQRTYEAGRKEKAKLHKLLTQLDDIAAIYFDRNEDVADAIVEVKREIRLITTGSPATESMDPPSAGSPLSLLDDGVKHQLDDAQMQLLKRAYRKLAAICHPDKPGGSVEEFQAVQKAYENQDLDELIYLYVTHFKFRNLYWRQSFDGLDFVFTEVNRPRTQMAMMQNSPLMRAAGLHICGRTDAANDYVRRILLDKLAALTNELNHLRETHHECN